MGSSPPARTRGAVSDSAPMPAPVSMTSPTPSLDGGDSASDISSPTTPTGSVSWSSHSHSYSQADTAGGRGESQASRGPGFRERLTLLKQDEPLSRAEALYASLHLSREANPSPFVTVPSPAIRRRGMAPEATGLTTGRQAGPQAVGKDRTSREPSTDRSSLNSDTPHSQIGHSQRESATKPPDPDLRAPQGAPSVNSAVTGTTYGSNARYYQYSPKPDSVPSLVSDHDSVPSNASVPTSLGSAVSGYRTFDSESAGETQQQPYLRYECFCHYLECRAGEFHDFDDWDTHCRSHFRSAGPPVQGSQCPFCDFQARPTMLAQPHCSIPALSVRNIDQIKRRCGDKTPYQYDARYRQQADKLWDIRQKHVAQHFEAAYSNATAAPDHDMIKYMWSKNLIPDSIYKDLTGQAVLPTNKQKRDTSPYTSVGGGRRERDRR